MLIIIAFWLLVILICFWILFDTFHVLWEIIMQIYNKKTIDLQTKFSEWAVVTGSTDGIGKAYAKELAARNMNLILISRNLEKFKHTKDEMLLINSKIQVKILAADFAEGKDAFTKIHSLLQDISVGILVNNVGKFYEYPEYVGEILEKELWDIININISSIFVLDATTYARNAIATLGKMDNNTGYWAHSIQKFIILMIPIWIRMKIGQIMNESFRQNYFKQQRQKTL
ncbi:Hydroxysteroid dehydrogenase-like protein 1 [Atta colombica]|uniref:Hydroxysteroid dehydrogenase-like protein 1 n=1 Tax=Atta colombica TaxID=520822 RepID=A0A151I3X1_9HYME|nr:Hydroxysteroid dehydrogenase-like protein 1 [Atta colombica]